MRSMPNLPGSSEALSLIASDTDHWQNCKPPLSPNEKEIALYRELVRGKSPVCLLGMTKGLVPLCDLAVDLTPINVGIPTLQSDWNDLSGRFGAVIGDGVLNLAGMGLIEKMLKISDRFVARVFMKKQPGMKYATFFPVEFPGCKSITITQDDIAMVVWEANV